jgi:UDP-N-acetylmuramoyl-tripeptide--D-alanyl-D-alanine ligase
VSGVRLTVGWLAKAVGGRIAAGDPDREIGKVVTDSRAVEPGDFFVALQGPRFDGRAFVDEAIGRRGACGALIQARDDGRDAGVAGAAIVEVDDTIRALQDLARAVRVAAGTKVVAITGSAGKTTTKDTIADFLSTGFVVVKNKGNLNNHIGLPLSLLQLREGPDVAIADPDVRVWTNVGDAHLGHFASSDAIADAKAEILEGAGPQDVLVCNADDPRVMARVGRFAGRTVTFGEHPGAIVRAREIEDRGIDGTRARVATPAGDAVLQTPLLGRGNLSNVLAATAVALDFGIPLSTVVERAATLTPADRRGVVRRLRAGVTLVDDSYNSSPSALMNALDVIGRETRAARKVAVLGEMLELGAHANALHEDCGRAAAVAGLGLLFAIGGKPAQALARAAVAAGMPAASVTWTDTSEAAASIVAAAVRSGDLVLVKGSRGTRCDVVADRISADFA